MSVCFQANTPDWPSQSCWSGAGRKSFSTFTPSSVETGAASSSSSGSTLTACQRQFDPTLIASEDCSPLPVYGTFCPESTSTSITNSSTVNSCDDVSVAKGTATANGLSSDFVVVTPSTGGTKGTYLALHWALANGPTMVNRLRLSELAKARDITVIAPTAPGPVQTWGNSLVNPTSTVADRIALLQAVLAAAKGSSLTPQVAVAGSTPRLIVSGLSGGGIMAYDYACANADTVTGVEIVAAEITPADVTACAPTKSVATVQVHGTNDLVAPYSTVPFLPAWCRCSSSCTATMAAARPAFSPPAWPAPTRWSAASACSG